MVVKFREPSGNWVLYDEVGKIQHREIAEKTVELVMEVRGRPSSLIVVAKTPVYLLSSVTGKTIDKLY